VSKYIKIIVSDCHLGNGATLPDGGINPIEDFRKDDKFVEFLDHYSTGVHTDDNVELIINGDFFDMLQTRTTAKLMPYEIIESIAVYKIRRILRGHPKVIKALKNFIERGKHVKMIWGNHDAGLWWPGVQAEIRKAISQKVEISLVPYIFDGVRIEHGHQYEIVNHFDLDNMFIERGGRRILNYPFGSFFVGGFLAQVKLRRSYITQVVPFNKFLRWSLIFDFWFTVFHGFKSAWFFFKMRFIFHPLRFTRFSKTFKIMFEIFRRPKFVRVAKEVLKANGSQILLMGHNHQPGHFHYPDGTQYVNTGTWTDVISFDAGSLGRMSRPTYAVIEYPDGVSQGQGVLPQVSLRVWRGKHHEWEVFEP
jgi:UDP-2,3-diacylglucosamine pyrophosphatase LpxH